MIWIRGSVTEEEKKRVRFNIPFLIFIFPIFQKSGVDTLQANTICSMQRYLILFPLWIRADHKVYKMQSDVKHNFSHQYLQSPVNSGSAYKIIV